MATRNIIKVGDDNLRKICRPVEKFDQRLWQLLDDLKDTLDSVTGYGLASPQVNVLRRAVVIDYEGMFFELVNPVLLSSEGECLDNEGCLSVDECRGIVKRPEKIEVEYYDRFGKKQNLKAEGYFARVVLHEMDHLDGVLFIDKMVKRIDLKKRR